MRPILIRNQKRQEFNASKIVRSYSKAALSNAMMEMQRNASDEFKLYFFIDIHLLDFHQFESLDENWPNWTTSVKEEE